MKYGKTITMEKMVAEHMKRHPTVSIVTVRRGETVIEKHAGSNMTGHRVNYGRLHPGKTYKADCSCGWTFEGTRDETHKAVRDHDGTNAAEALDAAVNKLAKKLTEDAFKLINPYSPRPTALRVTAGGTFESVEINDAGEVIEPPHHCGSVLCRRCMGSMT